MPQNQKKVKLIVFLAILIALLLFAVSVVQIVCIQKLSKQASLQQKQITELNNKLDYYANLENDNKQADSIIVVTSEVI